MFCYEAKPISCQKHTVIYRSYQLSSLTFIGMSQSLREVWKESRIWRRTKTSDLVLGLGTLVRRLQSLEGEGMLRDLHLLRVPAWKATSSACKPGRQGLGKPEKSPSFSFPLPPATLLPCLLCVLWCPIPQSSVGKTLHQQQQDNKGHVNERPGGGRGEGWFWQQYLIISGLCASLNSLLPEPDGIGLRARSSLRDHPAWSLSVTYEETKAHRC